MIRRSLLQNSGGKEILLRFGMNSYTYDFNYKWTFKLADAFPLKNALEATRDAAGRYFYERDYCEENWEEVSLPHTYNDKDLFVNRIQDAGSDQKRTFSCYRKWFRLPWVLPAGPAGKGENPAGYRVFLESEGIRQTCYLYVNGTLAGYYEAGVAPIGFDLTPYLTEGDNLVAIATDSTSTRNLDYFSAETPNHPDAVPGTFISSLTEKEMLPGTKKGVGYFWNCNDFNPCVGGLSRNMRLHIKPLVYLTLPLYSNLRTKGTYVYASDFQIEKSSARIHVEAEVRNESGKEQKIGIQVLLKDHLGEKKASFDSREFVVPAADAEAVRPVLTIIPKDAYRREGEEFVPVPEEEAAPTVFDSVETSVCEAQAVVEGLRFWSPDDPYLYQVEVNLLLDGEIVDTETVTTGFRKVEYCGWDEDGAKQGPHGLLINGKQVWLTGYAQRATNEWAAIGTAVDWLKDVDARLIRESNANHIRFMHVAGSPADLRSFDRYGVVCTQPAGDKERENFGRQWDQRVELMRDVIVYFRNHPSILFWEAGNNSINQEHMREMRILKEHLDPHGGRFMGCRTINTEDVVAEAEYVGTMLNRHAAPFISSRMPITETEYLREEAPRRVWDDFTPPDYDYDNRWLGKMGRKQPGGDCHDLTSEDLALCAAKGYAEFFNDRVGGASGRDLYCATAALCWTDSAQHGRQAFSENARMSGRVDPVRIKKQNFRVFQTMQSPVPMVSIVGHWNYPPEGGEHYRYALKEFRDGAYEKTGEYGYRNPHDKTIYVIGSYTIARVELYVNGELAGSCDRPQDTFVFAFPHMDITRSGNISAAAYDYEGKLVAGDVLETTGDPAALRLTLYTGEEGFQADGADIAYIDVEVLDERGRVCPLADQKITFHTEGPAEFLGGYNSGRFRGFGRDDSVIHQDHVYAECGLNRVFLRSAKKAGEIAVTAVMEEGSAGGEPIRAELRFRSVERSMEALESRMPQHLTPRYAKEPAAAEYAFPALKEADAVKYHAPDKLYCKVLVNGQEPGTNGVLSVVDHGSIYSPILFILESMHNARPEAFDYRFENGVLTLTSGSDTVTAEVGRTHLLVNGEENLLNGQPYLNDAGVLIVEINAVITYIKGVTASYDEKVNVFRIRW